MGLYQKVLPVGIGITLCVTSFALGIVFGQVPYTHITLFGTPTELDFEEALVHYQRWYNLSPHLYHLLYAIAAIGFCGPLILVYKPSSTLKLYDYTCLGLYFLTLCVFITNIKTGMEAAVYDTWGEVDMPMGVNVIGATLVMIVVLLIGILVLQFGRYMQTLEDQKSDAEYAKLLEEEKLREKKEAEEEKIKEEKQARKEERNTKKYGHRKSD